MVIASFFTNTLGILLFLFIFWKKMKEDFGSEVIFRSSSFVFLGISIFYLLAFNFLPLWSLWFTFIGGILGLLLAVFSQKIKFFESLEAFIVSSLPWLSLIFLNNSIVKSSFTSFVAFIFILILVFVSYWIDINYKSFRWYKSGKIGLSGLLVLALIFLVRSVVAIVEIDVLSFVGQFELLVSSIFFIITVVLIFYLAKYEK